MGMIFTVEDDVPTTLGVATVTARQLAAFRAVAAAHEARFNVAIIIDPGLQGFAPCEFEACVCPMALATIARAFDFDLAMIALIEEAQFRGRLIRFERNEADGAIHAAVSERASR